MGGLSIDIDNNKKLGTGMGEEKEEKENWKHWAVALILILLPTIFTYIGTIGK